MGATTAAPATQPRVIITAISPEIEGGRFPVKRIQGDLFSVTADIFADGHDALRAVLLSRRQGEEAWAESPMHELANDAWYGEFEAGPPGFYEYTIEAWIDEFGSWRRDLAKRLQAAQDVTSEMADGAKLAGLARERAVRLGAVADAAQLVEFERRLRSSDAASSGTAEPLAALMDKYAGRNLSSRLLPLRPLWVDRGKARFSTWYELFPRSCSSTPGAHGTFRDCERRLPAIAAMGFDVLYLPPIHPIGRTHRKGKNNAPVAEPGDPGSPWAIGAEEGGHTAIHPALGTQEDFARLAASAGRYGLEMALDLAFQCSPDHPWVREHPEWFRHRPDGTIRFAENPPKKYEDIYPLDFECENWRALWDALLGVVAFWIEQGICIFRVDNPHTKPFAFWEWLIRKARTRHPEVIFLAEAFTRPKVMKRLAQIGFSQSYTYFAWRNAKLELTEYFTELTQSPMREYFRPNLWPNTPDILTEYLQFGARPAFVARLVLAATLGANYGIYGPPFERCENTPIAPGTEEYLNTEKYEIRYWPEENPEGLVDVITRVNKARRENTALQSDGGLRFHNTENDALIAYTKSTPDGSNVVLTVVNLDPRNAQSGWVTLPLDELRISGQASFQVHDLLSDAHYLWQGPRNYVRLDPVQTPAHLFRVRQRLKRENDFDYFV